MMKRSKIPTLAVKLAKVAYFEKKIMSKCSVRDTGALHALPEAKLQQMKNLLKSFVIHIWLLAMSRVISYVV